jgi:hypothetical protein
LQQLPKFSSVAVAGLFATAISSSKFRLSLVVVVLLLLIEIRSGSVVESGIAIKLITHLAPQLLPSKV